MPRLTDSQKNFLAVLEAFSEPIPMDAAMDLSPISPGELLELGRKLEKNTWLIVHDRNMISLSADVPQLLKEELKAINSMERLQAWLSRVRSSGLKEQISPAAHRRLQQRCEYTPEEVRSLYREGLTALIDYDYQASSQKLDACLSLIKEKPDEPENQETLFSAAEKLASLTVERPRIWKLAHKYLGLAETIAQKIGDQRNLALINLYTGWLFIGQDRAQEGMSLMQKGLDMVNDLGDEDILVKSGEFFGYYYHSQGRFKEAFEHFEKAISHNISQKGAFLPLFFSTYCNTAAHNGYFYQAVGIINSELRRLAPEHNQEHNQDVAQFCRACLGTVLLMMGKKKEALENLEAALFAAKKINNHLGLAWARRGLAYYYFLTGDIHKSYEFARKCLIEVDQIGYFRSYYSYSWFLELSFAYHEQGFEPVPGLDITQELAKASQGANIQLRGTALRLMARQAEKNGAADSVVKTLLERSAADLKMANTTLDLAKTYTEMARLALRSNDEPLARQHAIKAWELLNNFNSSPFPAELRRLIEPTGTITVARDFSNNLLRKSIDMIDDLFAVGMNDEPVSKLVMASTRFFEAERGGFFRIDDSLEDGLDFQFGRNLTLQDVEADNFKFQLKCMREVCQKNRPLLKEFSDQEAETLGNNIHSFLCLPFRGENRLIGVLYFDNSYVEGFYRSTDLPDLTQITNHIGRFYDRIIQQNSKLEERCFTPIIKSLPGKSNIGNMVTQNHFMLDLLAKAELAATSDAPVLIQGETGVGKELLAQYIHDMSPRSSRPFLPINISSIPEALLESELFGHEKGAFTGAVSRKTGLMELADQGTLFIDEVGDIPMSIQVKLLRALEDKALMRVGGTIRKRSDFRIISATNKDMPAAVASEAFRQDLYYRLNVISLTIPPLRERGHDIVHLAEHYLAHYAKMYTRTIPGFGQEDIIALKSYHWPGNVRELKNVIERAVIMSGSEHLELTIPGAIHAAKPQGEPATATYYDLFSGQPSMEELQRSYILFLLKNNGGKISGKNGVAEILGMKVPTLYSRMKKLGISLGGGYRR